MSDILLNGKQVVWSYVFFLCVRGNNNSQSNKWNYLNFETYTYFVNIPVDIEFEEDFFGSFHFKTVSTFHLK